jgi:cytochrome c553
MIKLLTSVLMVFVASATSLAYAEDAAGDAKAGETKIAMCIGCHGIKGYQASFPEVYKVPKISGQSAAYIVSALTAYQKGERKHPTMRSVATSLTAKDMADIAAYYEVHGKDASEVLPEKATEPTGAAAALVAKGACTSCHGANLNKPMVPGYPKIAGQHKDYLYVALKSYKEDGQSTWGRGNGVMGGIAKQFSLAELKELAAYVSSQQGELKTVPQSKFR